MIGLFMRSIRWRLPVSYAVVALVAVISLGFILQTTLREYYEIQEFRHLQENARGVSFELARYYENQEARPPLEGQLKNLSFLAQLRIRLLDKNGQVMADSGSPNDRTMISIGAPSENMTYFYAGEAATPIVLPAQASITLFNVPAEQEDTLILSRPEQPDVIAFGVAGTPFGFGFNQPDFDWGSRSDQKVQMPVILSDNTLIGYVELSEGPAYGTQIVKNVQQNLLRAGIAAVVLAILVGLFVSHQISTPVLQLANVTRRMSTGDLSARVTLNRRDEFGLLAKSFNEMAGRVEHTILALRSFVADAAHELHTPLTAIHANLELAVSEPAEPQKNIFIHQALMQLKRLESLTNDLLDLSRIEAGIGKENRQTVDMGALLRETSELYASRADQSGITFCLDVPDEPIPVLGNEIQIRRVIGNLLDNALKFTPENGSVRVELRKIGERIQLRVLDTGIGIPAEDVPFLFRRFHRGRNTAAYPGSGLGLAITRAIVEGHRGKISVESSPQGTCFLLQLPV